MYNEVKNTQLFRLCNICAKSVYAKRKQKGQIFDIISFI